MFSVVDVVAERGAVARSILAALPEWFGLPDALNAYVEAAEELPMLAAQARGSECVGFVSLKRHTHVAAEAFVLGVRRDWHRRGCGRALFGVAERRLAAIGVQYLTVKTLAADHPDPHYARTRAFYEAIGFVPIEVLPTLWGEGYPCLLMVKQVG